MKNNVAAYMIDGYIDAFERGGIEYKELNERLVEFDKESLLEYFNNHIGQSVNLEECRLSDLEGSDWAVLKAYCDRLYDSLLFETIQCNRFREPDERQEIAQNGLNTIKESVSQLYPCQKELMQKVASEKYDCAWASYEACINNPMATDNINNSQFENLWGNITLGGIVKEVQLPDSAQ